MSVAYNTALHKCCCGCGNEVITPISPVDWIIGYDGKAVTLDPSIGNYSFECRSHYWIIGDRVKWVALPSQRRIDEDREADRVDRSRFYDPSADHRGELFEARINRVLSKRLRRNR